MIDVDRFAKRLSAGDLDAVIANLQSMQDVLCKSAPRVRKAERETARERLYMSAVLIGALIYDLAVHSGEDEAHARVLACSRLDDMAAQLSRGLLFVQRSRPDPA